MLTVICPTLFLQDYFSCGAQSHSGEYRKRFFICNGNYIIKKGLLLTNGPSGYVFAIGHLYCHLLSTRQVLSPSRSVGGFALGLGLQGSYPFFPGIFCDRFDCQAPLSGISSQVKRVVSDKKSKNKQNNNSFP